MHEELTAEQIGTMVRYTLLVLSFGVFLGIPFGMWISRRLDRLEAEAYRKLLEDNIRSLK